MDNALIGEWLDLKTVPPSKFRIERTDATTSYTNTGKQIPSIDLFDDGRYIKSEPIQKNIGFGEEFKNGATGSTQPQPTSPGDMGSFVHHNPEHINPYVQTVLTSTPVYTESQQFVNSAIQISKKQGKEFDYPITDTNITIAFDISFIKTTATALDVSTADVVKVMLDNMQIDVDKLKRSIIGNILGIDVEETLPPPPVVEEIIQQEPTELQPGYANGIVVSQFFSDDVVIIVDYIDTITSLTAQFTVNPVGIILQQFLTDPEAYISVIEDIKKNCGITQNDNISFDFNEEMYYTMLDKVKTRIHEPVAEETTPEFIKEEEIKEEIDKAKVNTVNLPRVTPLMDIWKRKNPIDNK